MNSRINVCHCWRLTSNFQDCISFPFSSPFGVNDWGIPKTGNMDEISGRIIICYEWNFLTLIWYWFSLNNSETVKAVILAFFSIQWHFMRDICATFGISKSHQSPDIVQNTDLGISNFCTSDQSLMNKNYRNSRTSNDFNIT